MKTTKKLRVHKETLRRLDRSALEQAAGGDVDSWVQTCYTCWCPTDNTCQTCPEVIYSVQDPC